MQQFLSRLLDMLGNLQRQASSPMASLDRSIAAAGDAHRTARAALAVATAVREEMAPATEQLIERMSDAGFGAPGRVRPADVLLRLRAAVAESQAPVLIQSPSKL
jgi:hypothetical protein